MKSLKWLISLCSTSLLLSASMAYSMTIYNHTGTKLYNIVVEPDYGYDSSSDTGLCRHFKKDFEPNTSFNYTPSHYCSLQTFRIKNNDKGINLCTDIPSNSDVYLTKDEKKGCKIK